MAYLYLLCGASGCGKTTLMNSMAAITKCSVDPSFHDVFEEQEIDPVLRLVRAPKYSERQVRRKRDEIDDIIHEDNITRETHGVCYVLNSVKYGFKPKEIEQLLTNDLNAVAIVSDLRAIRMLKDHFGDHARAVFVSSAIDADKLRRIQQERWGFAPDDKQKSILGTHFVKINAAARLGWWDRVSECVNDLEQDWHAYATDAKSTEIRIARIRATHIRYIEHIHLFDHVILNYSEGNPAEMNSQLRNIILATKPRINRASLAPIFVVAAASGAGKGTLMETLNFIGGDRIRIVSKLAKRRPKAVDRRDGMIALLRERGDPEPDWPPWWDSSDIDVARTGEFPDAYDLRWEFHNRARGGASTGTPYAISNAEVARNTEAGIAQVFVSNMGQFQTFRELWPNQVVFLYLHRLVSEQENREYQMGKWKDDRSQAEARIRERETVHGEFIKRAGEFHHVLLNTSYEEDLYDQMFNLLSNYNRGWKK